MRFTVGVDFPTSDERAYRYLSEPRNRPAWQASLRRVTEVRGHGEPGTTWVDVTAAGIRPRLEVTAAAPYRRWQERGTWRGVCAILTLRFAQTGPTHTRVVATVEVETPALLRPVALALMVVGPPALRSDLARAARLAAGDRGGRHDRGPG